jgi:hypothetical protein
MAAGLFSCGKKLTTQDLSAISGSQVWNSTPTAENFIYNTYDNVLYDGWTGGSQITNWDAYTLNNMTFGNAYGGLYVPQVFGGVLTNQDDASNKYNDFTNILACNMIISNVAASSGISASDKVWLEAEGYFLRGLQNYYVARSFGKIIWIDTVLGPDQNLRLPTVASPAESWHYIIDDLEKAAAGLANQPTPVPSGLATVATVEAFLGEAALEAEAYQHYPDAPNPQPTDSLVQLAISSANAAIQGGGYTIDPDYAGMFNGTSPNSPEIMFSQYLSSINTDFNNTPMQYLNFGMINGYIEQYGGSPLFTNDGLYQGWGGNAPTQNLADQYLVIDKTTGHAVQWDQSSQFLNAVTLNAATPAIPTNVSGVETPVEYGTVSPASGETFWTLTNNNRDARWAATIASDSTPYTGGNVLTMDVWGNCPRNMFYTTSFGSEVSVTNFYWNKYMWPVTPIYTYGTPCNYAYVVMRLGRVYLNLAEAELLAGNIPAAVAALNATRVQHGKLPPSAATGAADAWTDYKRERDVELTLENDYYWSLLRWGLYGGAANHGNAPLGNIPELSTPPKVTDISKDRLQFRVVTGQFYGSNGSRTFLYPQQYLLPIAYNTYILPNTNIVQNPGW